MEFDKTRGKSAMSAAPPVFADGAPEVCVFMP
jgi:hypothetical protein